MINKKQKFGMLLSVVLKPFLRISKINLRCFQNKYVVFQKRITSSFKIKRRYFRNKLQGISEADIQLFRRYLALFKS